MTIVRVKVKNAEKAKQLARFLSDIEYVTETTIESVSKQAKEELDELKQIVLTQNNPAIIKYLSE